MSWAAGSEGSTGVFGQNYYGHEAIGILGITLGRPVQTTRNSKIIQSEKKI